MSTRQKYIVGGAAGLGLVAGASITVNAILKDKDIDEALLDATLTVAGEYGVAGAEAFDETAHATSEAAQRIMQGHVNDLDNQ